MEELIMIPRCTDAAYGNLLQSGQLVQERGHFERATVRPAVDVKTVDQWCKFRDELLEAFDFLADDVFLEGRDACVDGVIEPVCCDTAQGAAC